MIEDACAIKGTGAMLHWLPDVAHQYAGHEFILVTDAQVGVPNGWTGCDRARTTMVLIPVNAERLSDQECLAKQLAQRVLIVQRPDQLPYLVALAARATMGTSG